jgi:hypothetical protein
MDKVTCAISAVPTPAPPPAPNTNLAPEDEVVAFLRKNFDEISSWEKKQASEVLWSTFS